jgi:hypothetical protein
MYWIFSSLMTYGLLWIWHRTDTKASKPNIPIFPFPSVRSLLSIRRKVRNFTRERYPKPLAREAECAGIEHRLKLIAYFPFYLLLGPITMLFLALPIRQQELRLNAPTDGMKPV